MVNRAKVRTKAEVLSIEKALDHDIVGKLVLKHEIHLGKNQVIGKGAEFYNKVILIVPLTIVVAVTESHRFQSTQATTVCQNKARSIQMFRRFVAYSSYNQ